MQPLNCKSFAKLNLCLHILDRRKDGYHNLESIFCIIDFYDTLSFQKNNSTKLNFKTNSNEIDSTYNLVTKAYDLISNLYDIEGIDIFLDKKIPIGSGLGGGSSNAAVTLLALNEIFKLKDCQVSLIGNDLCVKSSLKN